VTKSLTNADFTTGACGVTPDASVSSSRDTERTQVARLAQEFEALLTTQMLRQMRASMLSDDSDDDNGGLGKDIMTDTIDIELGRSLSQAGGLGLAAFLTKALDARAATSALLANQPTEEPAGAGAAAATVPADSGSPLSLPDGRLSSPYGWRRDPFTGAAKFHQGIDVAMAYGQDVRAAAAGRVAFAGDWGSYGTAVVIEHAGGRETRYAHLSSTDVRPGDVVELGQVIGQAGSSGRSTGPHVHFEVVESGRALNPIQGLGTDADSQ
jgi:murein DD-endopeptidase MepM/ murein hydrolase activator NlpD